MEITSEEQNKVKRMKRNEDNFRDLCDSVKHPNIQIIGVPEEKEKKKVTENIFEYIIVEKFSSMGKEIANQVQEAQSAIQEKPKEKHVETHTKQQRLKTKKEY